MNPLNKKKHAVHSNGFADLPKKKTCKFHRARDHQPVDVLGHPICKQANFLKRLMSALGIHHQLC